jgi:hypothetical protein|tara:strand:- start:396 stop:638 length:243 start_codon:yes stop_codon:yes gene_type:complete
MSFKFKLGELVVPRLAREMGIPVGPSKVTAIQLGGYIQIEPIGAPTYRRHLVEAEHYERFKEETDSSDIQDNDKASRRRT